VHFEVWADVCGKRESHGAQAARALHPHGRDPKRLRGDVIVIKALRDMQDIRRLDAKSH